MDRETFNRWLASYGSAWTGRDPGAAASLYADDATYQVTPFDEPLRGRAAIYEYWAGVARTEEKIQFEHEDPRSHCGAWYRQVVGVLCPRATWPKKRNWTGIFLISLDSVGRCRSLREWWHKRQ